MDEEEFSRMLFNKSLEIEPRGSKQATRYVSFISPIHITYADSLPYSLVDGLIVL